MSSRVSQGNKVFTHLGEICVEQFWKMSNPCSKVQLSCIIFHFIFKGPSMTYRMVLVLLQNAIWSCQSMSLEERERRNLWPVVKTKKIMCGGRGGGQKSFLIIHEIHTFILTTVPSTTMGGAWVNKRKRGKEFISTCQPEARTHAQPDTDALPTQNPTKHLRNKRRLYTH